MKVRQALVVENVAQCLSQALQRGCRAVVITLVMLAIAITSTGWNVAWAMSSANGALIANAPAAGHHAVDKHGHESGAQASDPAACGIEDCGGPHHQSQDLAQTCCAAACHTAILSVGNMTSVSLVAWPIKHHQLADVLEDAGTMRLERPPCLISA